jgi:hypothetical protein
MKKLLVTLIVSLLIISICPKIFSKTHYVSPFGGNVSPYTNWATAANTIEDAKSAATSWGSVIIVTNGTYSPGLFQFIGGKVLLQSVNGPEVTIIDGLGSNRCVQLGTGVPFVDITNQFTFIPAYVTSYNIYGTNNLQVAGYMRYTNSLSGDSNSFFAVSPWNISVAMAVGTNLITVTGTNNFGTSAYDSVTILRDSVGAYKPWISITNQSTNVSFSVSTYTIYGTNDGNVVGMTWWTNRQSGANGSFPAVREWTVIDIPLAFGTNNIVATGTNYFDVSSFSMIKIYRDIPEGGGVLILGIFILLFLEMKIKST